MKIPISKLKELAKQCGYTHIVAFAYDGKKQYIASHGQSTLESYQASCFADDLKKRMGWPDRMKAYPDRVKKMQDRIRHLEKLLQDNKIQIPKTINNRINQ